MKHNRSPRSPASHGRSPTRPPSRKPKGFADLDPSTMGLDMPEWMQDASPPSLDMDGRVPLDPVPSADAMAAAPDAHSNATSPSSRTITEGMKVVCICKGIKKRVFWKALDEGMCTKEDINRSTGSGSGSCQGRRCGPRILDMIRDISK